MTRVVLIGNPNCGKTTVFNALTGKNQRVGNWPGVTVEKKIGSFSIDKKTIELVDLPGIYSLSLAATASIDEKIAAKTVIEDDVDVIINVLDACHLERHLYLTTQMLELGKPMILALNMADIANQRGIAIDADALSKRLGCPVVLMQAHRKTGIVELKQIITQAKQPQPCSLALTDKLQQALATLTNRLSSEFQSRAKYTAFRILEGDTLLNDDPGDLCVAEDDCDVLMADARYQAAHKLVLEIQTKKSDATDHFTAKLDRIVLHRYLALPIFFATMYVMFIFAINIGGAFQDFFDISSDAIFVQGTGWLLQQVHTPSWLVALIANGFGKGINTTLTFIPVIASMYFFLALLETSGYMARAAFVVDKGMRAMGLPGKSFVPMIVGFGCNVPSVMAARTMDSERDRLLTVLMSPFMSCSARLAIYAIFVTTFFPVGGHNIVFSLYLIGIAMAVLTGLMLRKTLFKGQASPLIIELPAYHLPNMRRLIKETTMRLRYFIVRAGKIIIPVCVVLGGLSSLTLDGSFSSAAANSQSVLSYFGQKLTPLFAPMGLHEDNWPATVGLLTGMLAKEVVVGTLHTLYAQVGQVAHGSLEHFNLLHLLKEAAWSIPLNLSELIHALAHPIQASAPESTWTLPVGEIMYNHFDGKVGAYAYLLFVLLYIPCVSTMAVIRQEAGRKLMWFSVSWSLVVAYSVAVLFYQLATMIKHPGQSMVWFVSMAFLVLITMAIYKAALSFQGGQHVVENS